MQTASPQKVVVVGAGPVGALAALYAARRGHEVELYELRGDLRDPSTTPLNFTKSINLAMSERGVNSLRGANCVGLLDSILDNTIPMHGRMIHGRKNGEIFEESQQYDIHGRFIRAIDRAGLNKRLLDELESMPNVTFCFNHKLTGADFKNNKAWFEHRDPSRGKSRTKEREPETEVLFDFMIGADGAHSAVRFHLMKFVRMSYHQEYVDTLWCEFTIPPAGSGTPISRFDGFMLSPNHLHIWPAGLFMFIAIPSNDKSFTCTLFMSASLFESIDADIDSLVPFFEKNFPGVVNTLIEESALSEQYLKNPHLPLISIKCTPYHYGSSAVILGDAAHAMVPFYGQGMNAGLEDVRVLFDTLDKHTSNEEAKDMQSARADALKEYTESRTPDAHTIIDLAMENYQEMRSDVRSLLYLLRKNVEEMLNVWIPSLGFATKYSRVSFSNQRYSEVTRDVHKQGSALNATGATLGIFVAGAALAASWHWRKH